MTIMDEQQIPKIIHYVWFGKGEKSKLTHSCIESWKKHLPDYEIIEWNEDNFDVNMMQYTKEAYDKKKYAYVSDVVRLYVLYQYGGIYLDTDVEVIKTFNSLLSYKSFMGFESNQQLSTAIIGTQKNVFWLKELLELYEKDHFVDENGAPKLITNVERITNFFSNNYGLQLDGTEQDVNELHILPQCVLSPINMLDGTLVIDEKTLSIHRFEGSWVPLRSKINKKIYRLFHKIIGN